MIFVYYTIFVCRCLGRVIQRYYALYSGTLLKCLIMQARIQVSMSVDTLVLLIYFSNMRGGGAESAPIMMSYTGADPETLLKGGGVRLWSNIFNN